MMKNTLTAIALTSVALSTIIFTPYIKADSLSANVGATSNYLWRGLEQTNGRSAVSGGIDYEADSGLYIGTWASNADWAEGMTYELDVYGGYSATINEAVSYDIGFIYYAYPDELSGNADFSEMYVNLSFNTLTLGAAVLASGDNADAGDTLYLSADYALTIANETELAFHLGSYTGDWLAEESIDYGISLSKSGFTLGASKTDLDGDDVKVYVAYSVAIDL